VARHRGGARPREEGSGPPAPRWLFIAILASVPLLVLLPPILEGEPLWSREQAWRLGAVLVLEAAPFAIEMAGIRVLRIRPRTIADASAGKRRAAVLLGGAAAFLGLLCVAVHLLVRGFGAYPGLLVGGAAGIALGGGVLLLCWRAWGGRAMLEEALRTADESSARTVGEEPAVVRFLAAALGLGLAGWGAWLGGTGRLPWNDVAWILVAGAAVCAVAGIAFATARAPGTAGRTPLPTLPIRILGVVLGLALLAFGFFGDAFLDTRPRLSDRLDLIFIGAVLTLVGGVPLLRPGREEDDAR
jgi:hypothetical protein